MIGRIKVKLSMRDGNTRLVSVQLQQKQQKAFPYGSL